MDGTGAAVKSEATYTESYRNGEVLRMANTKIGLPISWHVVRTTRLAEGKLEASICYINMIRICFPGRKLDFRELTSRKEAPFDMGEESGGDYEKTDN